MPFTASPFSYLGPVCAMKGTTVFGWGEDAPEEPKEAEEFTRAREALKRVTETEHEVKGAKVRPRSVNYDRLRGTGCRVRRGYFQCSVLDPEGKRPYEENRARAMEGLALALVEYAWGLFDLADSQRERVKRRTEEAK